MRVLVTGGGGFVGSVLVDNLVRQGHQVVTFDRSSMETTQTHSIQRIRADLCDIESFSDYLVGVDAVVHLAAVAHRRRGAAGDVRQTFWPVNVDVTRRLAEATALNVGRRFVFLSSIGVNGDETREPFTESTPPNPSSEYGRSKLAAEQVITSIPNLEWTIIRAPMVIGPLARGNLAALTKVVRKGLPIPDVAPANQRHVVGVRNLAAFIENCITHQSAAGECFLIADDPAISTTDLVRGLAASMGKKALLVPLPAATLRRLARLMGRESALGAFWKTLAIDTTKAKDRLGWRAPFTLVDEISRAGQGPDPLLAVARPDKIGPN